MSASCPDFDFCKECRDSGVSVNNHLATHAMIEIPLEEQPTNNKESTSVSTPTCMNAQLDAMMELNILDCLQFGATGSASFDWGFISNCVGSWKAREHFETVMLPRSAESSHATPSYIFSNPKGEQISHTDQMEDYEMNFRYGIHACMSVCYMSLNVQLTFQFLLCSCEPPLDKDYEIRTRIDQVVASIEDPEQEGELEAAR